MGAALQAFASRRVFVTLLLGFSAGIPLALTGATLQAWMTQAGVSLSSIGIFSLVGLPYTVKFLWAPLLDRYSLPFLGKRRGWLVLFQLALLIGVFCMGQTNPAANLSTMALLALLVSFFSASQDIVVDAFRTEILKPEEQGTGAGVYVTGYRVAMLVSGAVALTMSDHLPWSTVYAIMACAMGIGIVASLIAEEPETHTVPAKNLDEAFTRPLIQFMSRISAFEIIAFIILYKMGDTFASLLSTPFLVAKGYSNTTIGLLNKFVGAGGTIVGAGLGGGLVVRWGIGRSLFVFGVFQMVSNLVYLVLTALPADPVALGICIGIENICGGLGTAAFTAFLMRLCSRGESAGQYAMLTSFMAVSRVLLGPAAGVVAEKLGWPLYFSLSMVLAVPGLAMLSRFPVWMSSELSPGEFRIDESRRLDPATIYGFFGTTLLFFTIPTLIAKSYGPSAILAGLGAVLSILGLVRAVRIRRYAPATMGLALFNLIAIALGWAFL